MRVTVTNMWNIVVAIEISPAISCRQPDTLATDDMHGIIVKQSHIGSEQFIATLDELLSVHVCVQPDAQQKYNMSPQHRGPKSLN
jgi:hypothetical protein